MGLLMLALVVCGLLVLLLPGADTSSRDAPPGPDGRRGRRLAALLVGLGVVMLIAASVLYLVAYGGAHGDVGRSWADNADARHARTVSVLLGLGGLASLVASRRVGRSR